MTIGASLTKRTSVRVQRRRVLALALPAALGWVLCRSARPAAAQSATGDGGALPLLTLAGVELPPIAVDPATIAFSITVDLGGDQPLATYVTARPHGMPALQRTEAGAWVAWDESPASLIDNRFAASGGRLTFAVSGGDFSQQSFPVEVSIAYRTAAGVKFGVFTMTAKP